MDLVNIIVNDDSVNARDVYNFIFEDREKKTGFSHWFNRTVNRYGFTEGKDFSSFLTKSNGGRPKVDYAVTLDMAKELAMISPTERGKQAREYFLRCEDIVKEIYIKKTAYRLAGIEARKGMTELVYQSGEDERMHGRGYTNYTRLVYSVTGIYPKYAQWKKENGKRAGFRNTLTPDELKRVESAEAMVKTLLELEKQYGEIKDVLKPLFEPKKLGE